MADVFKTGFSHGKDMEADSIDQDTREAQEIDKLIEYQEGIKEV